MPDCWNCGARMEAGDAFCGACGASLSSDGAAGPGDEPAERGRQPRDGRGQPREEQRAVEDQGRGPGRQPGRGDRPADQHGRPGRPAQPSRQDEQGQPHRAGQHGQPVPAGQQNRPTGTGQQGPPPGRRDRPGSQPGPRPGTGQGGPTRGQVQQEQPARHPGGPAAGGTGRRDLLKYGTGAAILAGGGWFVYDRVLGGGSATMRGREWLVSPDVLGVDGYEFGRVSISAVRENEATLADGQVSDLRTSVESLSSVGVSFEDSEAMVGAGSFFLITGTVDQETARQGLSDQGFREAGQYRGYQVYEDAAAVAVSADALVIAPQFGPLTPRERLEAVLDARAGQATRYHEADADCDALQSELGRGLSVAGTASNAAGQPAEDVSALGVANRLNGDSVNRRIVLVFVDASAVGVSEPADVGQYGFDAGRFHDPDLSVDGRIVRVEDEVPADEAEFTNNLP